MAGHFFTSCNLHDTHEQRVKHAKSQKQKQKQKQNKKTYKKDANPTQP